MKRSYRTSFVRVSTVGMSEAVVRDLFARRFGGEPAIVGVAPGRINLIGEHTDYNDGFVFPAAIDKVTYIAARITNGLTTLVSEQVGEAEPFDANEVQAGFTQSWSKYAGGMAWTMRDHGRLPNIEVAISSSVPRSGGVSSSAALELAFGVVWNRLADLGLSNVQLALLGQKCENGFVGVNCGIMDQMASAMGREGQAMFLDTRSLEIQYAPIPEGLSAVLCDTRKPRALTDSAYNERRSQCELASKSIGVPCLRDATMQLLDKNKNSLDETTFRRARHVITEDDRCVAFRTALEQADLQQISSLMKASHDSLRDDYEVSCFELDFMAESAQRAHGCVGARMTGAGFGGSCVALVKTDLVGSFIDETLEAYESKSGRSGAALVCGFVDGARVLNS